MSIYNIASSDELANAVNVLWANYMDICQKHFSTREGLLHRLRNINVARRISTETMDDEWMLAAKTEFGIQMEFVLRHGYLASGDHATRVRAVRQKQESREQYDRTNGTSGFTEKELEARVRANHTINHLLVECASGDYNVRNRAVKTLENIFNAGTVGAVKMKTNDRRDVLRQKSDKELEMQVMQARFAAHRNKINAMHDFYHNKAMGVETATVNPPKKLEPSTDLLRAALSGEYEVGE